jgi:hypothetical protein
MALFDYEEDPETIARKAMKIAAEVCVYTNENLTWKDREPRVAVTPAKAGVQTLAGTGTQLGCQPPLA